jgi:hypothetical protein
VINPPIECPMRIGGSGKDRMNASKCSTAAASPMPVSSGHSGVCTTWPASRYFSAQPSQLSADNHSPWISTIGVASFDIVSSVEPRYDFEAVLP